MFSTNEYDWPALSAVGCDGENRNHIIRRTRRSNPLPMAVTAATVATATAPMAAMAMVMAIQRKTSRASQRC
jgi:hypothetical protein